MPRLFAAARCYSKCDECLVESSYEAKRVVLRLQQRLMMINEFRDISFGSRRIEHSACCDGDYPDCHFRVGIFLPGEN
jgi:hypothetical protein